MSSFGRLYRVMTFGESHCQSVGCVIQGFPSNFSVSIPLIQAELDRRKPGQSSLTTPREQSDTVRCVSGLQNGITLGSPLCFLVDNKNIKKKDYDELKNVARPGHADFTYLKKYGVKAESGGGRASARETIGRVIAGTLAKQFLKTKGIIFASYVKQISTVKIPEQINKQFIDGKITNEEIQKMGQIFKLKTGEYVNDSLHESSQIQQKHNLRCPHFESARQMLMKIQQAKQNKDSVGGVVQGCIYNLPVGLGEPCFDKLPALMAHAMLSIPATKGFQFGRGFSAAEMKGSEHNDKFKADLRLQSNNSGGTLGGISTGQTFYYDVAFKPVSSIGFPQETHDLDGKPLILETKGRHDPCVLPRAPPIVDNMSALVIMDLWLMRNSHQIYI